MRKLLVSEFITLDGVIQAPGGKDEDRDGGFEHGGWTMPYWHDDIGKAFGALMQDVDAFLLGRRTYVTHAQAFEPMPVRRSVRRLDEYSKEVRGVTNTREAHLAEYIHNPRQRDRVRPGAEGPAGPHHYHRRQQPAGARAAGARSRGRTAPAVVSANVRDR